MTKLSFTTEIYSKKSRLRFKSKSNFIYQLKSKLKAKLRLLILSLFSLVFIACGGGGSSSSSSTKDTKQPELSIHDSAIQGLDYILKSKEGLRKEGVTKKGGIFPYTSTDTSVTFKIGNLLIGTFNLSGLNTDKKILIGEVLGLGRDTPTNKNAVLIKVLRVLQSLDDDGDLENGIMISDDIKKKISKAINKGKNIKNIDIDNLVKNIAEKTLVSEEDALAHYKNTLDNLDKSINLSAISGDKQITLSWNKVSGATYNIYYSSSSISDIKNATKITNISATIKTITNLTNGIKYYFVITSLKDGIESTKSTEISLTAIKAVVRTGTSTLNDTGITWAGNSLDTNSSTCSSDMSAPQDCNAGRDANKFLTKIGGGSASFDFTRLGSTGSVYTGNGDYATNPWSCVRDNYTGLVWEIKTDDKSIHDKNNLYAWGGISAIGRDDTPNEYDYYDDWNPLVNGSNTGFGLCGFTNWKVPTREELRSIVHYGKTSPSIDKDYFPNTVSYTFWSSSYNWEAKGLALVIAFEFGNSYGMGRLGLNYVRLVRTVE